MFGIFVMLIFFLLIGIVVYVIIFLFFFLFLVCKFFWKKLVNVEVRLNLEVYFICVFIVSLWFLSMYFL